MFLIGLLALLILIYGIVGTVLRYMALRDENGNVKKIILPYALPGIPVGIVLLILVNFIVKVGAQEVGVVITPRGVQSAELKTGWHIVPTWNEVRMMDITTWVYSTVHDNEGGQQKTDAIWVACKDRIKMKFDVSTNWRIDPDHADWIYINLGGDRNADGNYDWIEDNIVRPAIKNAVTDVAARYTSDECFVNRREDVAADIAKHLKESLKANHIIVTDAMLRETNYEADYQKAINNTKLAEQEVKRQMEITKQLTEKELQAEKNKQIAIKQSEGEAEAIRIKANAISNNPKVLDLEWINRWDGTLPTHMMGSGQGVMLNLNK